VKQRLEPDGLPPIENFGTIMDGYNRRRQELIPDMSRRLMNASNRCAVGKITPAAFRAQVDEIEKEMKRLDIPQANIFNRAQVDLNNLREAQRSLRPAALPIRIQAEGGSSTQFGGMIDKMAG
jgi:hypothetical protein